MANNTKLKNRKQVLFLYWLCTHFGINIEDELASIIPLIADKLGKSKDFKPTKSDVLNKYGINEAVDYYKTNMDPPLEGVFAEYSPEELALTRGEKTYIVDSDRCIISIIVGTLFDLAKLAPEDCRDTFRHTAHSITTKIPESMERVVKATAPPEPITTPTPAEQIINPRKQQVNAPAPPKPQTPPPPPPKSSKKSSSLLPSQANLSRSYADVIKLAAEKKLPVYFYQDIGKKKIGKGIYIGCRIKMKDKHKTSKKAIFIDCIV